MTNVPAAVPPPAALPAPSPLPGWQAWWFAPLAPAAWAGPRAAFGLLLVWWMAALGGHAPTFFGAAGALDDAALQASVAVARGDGPLPELNAGLPDPAGEGVRVLAPRWSPLYAAGSPGVVRGWQLATAAAGLALAWGVLPRLAATVGWLGACVFSTQPGIASGGAEAFVLLAAFAVLLGSWTGPGSGQRFALRLWQLQAALWFVGAGLAKAQHGDWWQGVALWQAAHPAGSWTAEAIQNARRHPEATELALQAWAAAARTLIIWQLWFPAFAWTAWGRWAALAGGGVALAASVGAFGDPLFGPAVAVTTLAFLRERDWRWWPARRGPRRPRAASGPAAP